MPHKHTRKEKDESSFNLPPTEIAKPLPATIAKRQLEKSKQGQWKGNDAKAAAAKGNTSKGNAPPDKKNKKRKRGGDKDDDAPRAFKRLIAFAEGKKPRGGLDDGIVLSKKQKKAADAEAAGTSAEPAKPAKQSDKQEREIPTIRPGERLAEFGARVDAALPLSGLITKQNVKNGKDVLGIKVPRTRKEKKMHKLYDQWREEEKTIQEKREEAAELAEEEEMDDEQGGVKWKIDMEDDAARKGKKKGKKGRVLTEVAGKEEDPWEELKRKRGEAKIGLHDVAKAPPELTVPTAKLPQVRGAAVNVGDIPKAAGSLRKREELQSLRSDVIASYRKMRDEKRPSKLP